MKYKAFLTCLIIIFFAEISVLLIYANYGADSYQDAVEVNEALQSGTIGKISSRIKTSQVLTTLYLTASGTLFSARGRGLAKA